jgi:high-affinity Fe2+/Pb2+ permease
MQSSDPTLIGTAGGTFLSMLPNLHSEDILKTVLLAVIGAIVSFVLSMMLKFIVKKRRK